MATIKQVQKKYNLISEAEAAVVLRYADELDGDLDAAANKAISERVAPYILPEFIGGAEGPNVAGSIGSEPSIGKEHSVAGINPANDPDASNPLVTDLTDKTVGQYETGPDGLILEDGQVKTEEEVNAELTDEQVAELEALSPEDFEILATLTDEERAALTELGGSE